MGTIVVAVVLITNGFCLFKYVTKIDCPGCGLTRAYLAMFSGNFKAAIGYHEMFWAVPILMVLAGHITIVKRKCNKTIYITWAVAFGLLLSAFIIRYIIKLVFIYA